jgi:hypothetical protein
MEHSLDGILILKKTLIKVKSERLKVKTKTNDEYEEQYI